MNELEQAVGQLYVDLTALTSQIEELEDVGVREAIAEVLAVCFVEGRQYDAPATWFELGAAEDNRRVSALLEDFVEEANALAEEQQLAPGEARHQLLADPRWRAGDEEAESWWPGEGDEYEPGRQLSTDRFRVITADDESWASDPSDSELV